MLEVTNTDVRLHRRDVEALIAGRLSPDGEAQLAEHVAHVVLYQPVLPTVSVGVVGRLVRHLGGQTALLAWLDGFGGTPRRVAAIVYVNDLLCALSSSGPVLAALGEVRRRLPANSPLRPLMPPVIDHVTLSDLAEAIKVRMQRGRTAEAMRIAGDALTLVDKTLAVAARSGADTTYAEACLDEARMRLQRADEAPVTVPDQPRRRTAAPA